MDVFEAVRTLRAVRDFDTRPVPDAVVTRILQAARWSGSSKNTQPWQFIVVRARATLDALAECGDYTDHLRRANLAIVVCTEKTRRADFDAGRCIQNMQLAAWGDGIGSCIASLHRQAEAKRILDVPDEYEIQQALSFGYPAPGVLERPPRPGARKPLETMVHYERWDNKNARDAKP